VEEALMTAGEAASYLGVSVQRVDRLGATGRLTRRRVGRFWIYSRASVEAWKRAPKSKGGRPRKRPPDAG
jgi:excisionase family DNA binding protein